MTSPLEDYVNVLRSPATKQGYSYGLHRVLCDPNDFLNRAGVDPKSAEDYLVSFIQLNSESISAGSIATYMAAVHSFLDFQGVSLNWARIMKFIPTIKRISADRAPTTAEIRKALGFAETREKAVVLVMASSGMRIGGFDWLNVGDITYLQCEAAKLRVYRDEPEEYLTFVSREATSAVREYLQIRQDSGEHIFPDSPLIRSKWDDDNYLKAAFGKPKAISSSAIGNLLWKLWLRAGVRVKGAETDFKLAHGFRKFFKTNSIVCPEHGEQDIETMMGHLHSYYKPTIEHLEDQYLKSEPYLTIN